MSTHLSTDTLLGLIAQAEEKVPVDSLHRHKKSGAEYYVMQYSFIEATMELHVLYYSPNGDASAINFSRPLDEFLEKFEPVCMTQ